MESERRKFQGAINILSFNRHFYFMGLALLAVLLLLHSFMDWPRFIFWIILVSFTYGLLMPLFVSAYVYDFSGFYSFNWLKKLVSDPEKVKNIVNINAGFDETSFILKRTFPQSELKVLDFYNAKRHTEPAIVRARKVSITYPDTRHIVSNAIPLAEGCADIVFLLSAVHEIRSHDEKVQFLKECHRLCKSNGTIIMVEHLRDLPNFLAFTVGFTHFFSRSVWKNAFEKAGFDSVHEIKFTPFLSIFYCNR